MADYTIRPNSIVTNGGKVTALPAGTVLANLSDNSDATYTDRSATSDAQWAFGVPTPSVPADEFCWQVSGVSRWQSSVVARSGVRVRRAADPVGVTPVSEASSASPVNTASLENVTFSAADLASLVLDWRTNVVRTFDVWGVIRTTKRSVATPQATTMSTSAVPVVPVQVVNVVTALELVPTGTRKVRVDVRIESGGTTVGTGTLVAEHTLEFDLTVDGSYTSNVNAVFSDSLANGTYRVYARATRFRNDYPTVRADQQSAWSAAAILTMSVPLPNTPTLVLTKNDAAATVTATVTGTSSAGYSSPTVTVERRNSLTGLWEPVRNATRVPATFGVALPLIDREARRGFLEQYRARISATYTGGAINDSAWSSTQNVTLETFDTWNLRCPEEPSLDVLNLRVVGSPTEKIDEDLGIFRPLGRRYPVVVAGELTGWDGELQVHAADRTEWLELQALLESQKVLLLQTPYLSQKYIRVVGGARAAVRGTPSAPRRTVTLTYVETEAP